MQDSPIVPQMIDRLSTLTPAELEELDTIITPRAAALLVKAFGPEFHAMLSPLTERDDPAERKAAEAELRRTMRDPRYWRDRDPAVVGKIGDGFRKLFPGEARG